VTEARLRLHEGAGGAQIIQDQHAPIESYLETMRSSGSKLSSSVPRESSMDARRPSPTLQPKGTNLPFPRVQTSPAIPKKLDNSPSFPKAQFGKQMQSNKAATSATQMSISAAAAQSSRKGGSKTEPKNPFEEEDDSNNPFLEDEQGTKTKNPFEDDDDYDPSLNPFAE